MIRPQKVMPVAGRIGAVPHSSGGFGPNLLTQANGPYTSGNWAANQLTETTGQTDPLGGSTASLLTDNAVNSTHSIQQNYTFSSGFNYRITLYFKPGTYTGGISIGGSFGLNTQGVFVSNTGVMTAINGTPYNFSSTTVGGFFQIIFTFTQPASGVGLFLMSFNNGFSPYIGSSQTQTFWGIVLQQAY